MCTYSKVVWLRYPFPVENKAHPYIQTSCVDMLPVSCREYGLSTHTHKLCVGLEGGRAEALEVKGWRPKICGETLSRCTVSHAVDLLVRTKQCKSND